MEQGMEAPTHRQLLALYAQTLEDIRHVQDSQWRILLCSLILFGGVAGFYQLFVGVFTDMRVRDFTQLMVYSCIMIGIAGTAQLLSLQSKLMDYRRRLKRVYQLFDIRLMQQVLGQHYEEPAVFLPFSDNSIFYGFIVVIVAVGFIVLFQMKANTYVQVVPAA